MSFWIRLLVATLDRSEPDRSCCTVRALQLYMSRTDPHRAGRKPLFLPLRVTASQKLSPNPISVCLKKTISLPYEVAGKDEELRRLHSIQAHKTRVFSAFWDTIRSVSVEGIMAACRWRSHNTFTSFYLRDLVEMEARLLVLKCFPTAASNRSLGCLIAPSSPCPRGQAWGAQDGLLSMAL